MTHHHGCCEPMQACGEPTHEGCCGHSYCHGAKGHSHGGHHHTTEDWETQKMEWLIEMTKEAYHDLLMDSIRGKLSSQVNQEVEQLSDMATEKFTNWWKLKREQLKLKRRFRRRFEDFINPA